MVKPTMQDYLNREDFDVIIDVREKSEYQMGHIAGSFHLPLSQIAHCPFHSRQKIAVYCRSGRRSETAKNILKAAGYQNVTNIGGILDGSVNLVKEP